MIFRSKLGKFGIYNCDFGPAVQLSLWFVTVVQSVEVIALLQPVSNNGVTLRICGGLDCCFGLGIVQPGNARKSMTEKSGSKTHGYGSG